LALAAAWDRIGQGPRRAALLPCASIAALGAALVWAVLDARLDPATAMSRGWPAWLGAVPIWTGIAVGLAALAALALNRLPALALLAVATVVIVHLGLRPAARNYFDLGPAAAALARLEQAGRPIARIGEYHGQFNFLARLQRPIAVLPPG